MKWSLEEPEGDRGLEKYSVTRGFHEITIPVQSLRNKYKMYENIEKMSDQ